MRTNECAAPFGGREAARMHDARTARASDSLGATLAQEARDHMARQRLQQRPYIIGAGPGRILAWRAPDLAQHVARAWP